jgi:hypothetical protein
VIAIDTNLLIYAHREGCPEHQAARRAIEEAAGMREGWGIPAPCILEFWSVVTHPSSVGGGSSPAAAREFVEALVETAGAVILPPPAALGPRCLQIGEQLDIRGPRIFDVQIGLTALEAGVREIWTHDAGFIALPGLAVRDLLE